MSFEPYVTFNEYKDLGGKLTEEREFDIAERKAQRWLDYFTFDRIPLLPSIPEVVKEVLTEFVDRVHYVRNQSDSGNEVSEYSNGVEKFVFRVKSEDETKAECYKLAIEWLPDYLTARSVTFDVKQYLQSNGNNLKQT